LILAHLHGFLNEKINKFMKLLTEKKMRECIKEWLEKDYSRKKYDLEIIPNGLIKYGKNLEGKVDVLGIKYKLSENEKPKEREITDLFIVECKKDPWNYEGYGQLLYYKTLLEFFRWSKLWNVFNKDFYNGPKNYFKRHGKLPSWWKNYCGGDGKFVEKVGGRIKVHFFIALQKSGNDWNKVKSVAKSILSTINGRMLIGLLSIDTKSNKCEKEREELPLTLMRKKQPEGFFDVEVGTFIPRHEVWLKCGWFDKKGKITKECKKEPDPEECAHCESYRTDGD
jgi:hypothetical protein